MKHFLTFLLALSAFSVSAQGIQKETVIGRVKLPEGLAAELTYKIYSIVDTTFYFTFKDMQSKERENFTTIRFTKMADIEYLNRSLMHILNEPTKKAPALYYIGANEIGLKKIREGGQVRARMISGASYIDLSGSQIDLLFGKNSR